MGLPKPVIPATAPQEAISEEFNQLNVQDDPKNETFDKVPFIYYVSTYIAQNLI
jgi:hypothetical protein